MTKLQEDILKRSKLMLIDNKLAKDIEKLSKTMKTNSVDVLTAALELLKLSIGKNVSINEPGSNREVQLPIFAKFKSKDTLSD